MSGKAIRHFETIYTPYKRKKYSVIILGAGEGQRMKSFGPKPLLRLTPDETILDNQLRIIRSTFKLAEIIVVAGFEAEKVFKKFRNMNLIFVENENYNITNVSRSINIGLNASTTDMVLIIYGDLFLSDKSLCVPIRNDSAILTCNTMKTEEIGCTTEGGRVVHMHYDLNPKWGQVAFFTGRGLNVLKQIVRNRTNDKKFGFEIINLMLSQGLHIMSIPIPTDSVIYDIDSSDDLQHVRANYR